MKLLEVKEKVLTYKINQVEVKKRSDPKSTPAKSGVTKYQLRAFADDDLCHRAVFLKLFCLLAEQKN